MDYSGQCELERGIHFATRLAGRVNFYNPADPTVAGLAVPPSYKRVRIVFFAVSTGRWTLSNDANPVAGSGILIAVNTAPIVLRLEDCGDSIQKGFYAVGITGTTPLGWIDVQEETHCAKETSRVNGILPSWQGHT